MAVAASMNPLLLMIPATVASSLGFMMPAGTGPNTVIFRSERVTVSDMVKCGVWLNLISLIVLTILMYFIIMPWLNFEPTLPAWAQ
ncbi:MAG TPA: anion permease [Cyclobacteriaceae bacterium]|nr:anion permease [Cyclobacteriaceae bacterium]